MTDSFDLRALVREVCDASPVADPDAVVKEVSKRIGRNQQREALEQALPAVVQQVVSRSRGNVFDSSGGHICGDSQSRSAPGVRPSRKVAAIRAAWERHLQDWIAVGPKTWKFLGECNAFDLAFAAAVREDHARRNAARAAQYRRLAELLTEHGVDTVAQLPRVVVSETLRDEDEAA